MVRFGILGAGNIAHRIAASMAQVKGAELVAASCRSKEKAEAFLDTVEHGVAARAYGSHAELVADKDVDAIYVAVPHEYHFEWVTRALKAGKAVICEKPAMLNADEMREVKRIAREENVLFMEAMKPRFQPIIPEIQEALTKIGSIECVEASLMNDMLASVEGAGTYHMTPGPGAGVLLDCGTYCADWIAAYTDPTAPIEMFDATARTVNGVDTYVYAELKIGPIGIVFECAFDEAKPRLATILGSQGAVVVEELHRPEKAVITIHGREPYEIEVPYVVDDFYGEIDHFVRLIEEGKTESDVMSLDDSIRVAEVLDAIHKAALG